jgi:hypothetical protein
VRSTLCLKHDERGQPLEWQCFPTLSSCTNGAFRLPNRNGLTNSVAPGCLKFVAPVWVTGASDEGKEYAQDTPS